MHSPVIDTNEIIIETEDLPPFDSRLKIVCPQRVFKKSLAVWLRAVCSRLTSASTLVQIFLKVCVDEVLARQESPSLWGPAFVGRKPNFPQEGEDFSFEIMMDRRCQIWTCHHLKTSPFTGQLFSSRKSWCSEKYIFNA